MVTDSLSLTKFGDREEGVKVYLTLKQQGRDVAFKNGVVSEVYKDTTASKIADKIIKEVEETTKKLNEQYGNERIILSIRRSEINK